MVERNLRIFVFFNTQVEEAKQAIPEDVLFRNRQGVAVIVITRREMLDPVYIECGM